MNSLEGRKGKMAMAKANNKTKWKTMDASVPHVFVVVIS